MGKMKIATYVFQFGAAPVFDFCHDDVTFADFAGRKIPACSIWTAVSGLPKESVQIYRKKASEAK